MSRDLLIGIVIGILIGGIGMWFLKDCDSEIIEVPVKIEVPVPVVKDSFIPIIEPKPIYIEKPNPINSKLKDSLENAKSIIDSLNIYKNFAVKRNYVEKFEDSIQTITAKVETTGTLDKLGISYETKPRTIPLDTVVKTKVPKSPYFFYGGSVVIPRKDSDVKTSVKPKINYLNKKHNLLYNLEGDFINQTYEVGVAIKF